MTLQVKYQEIDLLQGSYLEVPLKYPNYVNGVFTPVDITGATIVCKFRKTAATNVVVSLSSPATIEITNAVNGEFKLKFTTDLTNLITDKGNTVLKGHVEVTLAGVTKRTHELTAYYSPRVNY